MTAEKTASDPAESSPVRAALIASKDTLFYYSVLLGNMLEGLANQNIEAVLVCPQDGETFSEKLNVIKHPAIEVPLMNFQNQKILIEQLEKFKPTVLHCLCQSKLKLTLQLADHFDIPYVVSINSFKNKLKKAALSGKHLGKIVLPSESIASNAAKVWHKYSDRMEHINPGTKVAQSKTETIVGQVPTIVTVNFSESLEQFESLLNAVRHLHIDGQEFMFVLISCRHVAKSFRKFISYLGLDDVITIVERPGPWPCIVSSADIFIQARPVKWFNPFLLHAMSSGAAVAGCKGGVDDLIQDGQRALVFDPDDELSIYSALQRLLDSRELSQKLINTAKQHLQENYQISTMTKRLIDIYRRGN